MSKVIRIHDDVYKRLELLANKFITPSQLIEKLLDELEELKGEVKVKFEKK